MMTLVYDDDNTAIYVAPGTWGGGLVIIVKLRRGSGKDRQGMASKAKGLKA